MAIFCFLMFCGSSIVQNCSCRGQGSAVGCGGLSYGSSNFRKMESPVFSSQPDSYAWESTIKGRFLRGYRFYSELSAPADRVFYGFGDPLSMGFSRITS